MIRPAGTRVLLKVEKPEEVTQGGVMLPHDTIRLEKRAIDVGIVEALGHIAYRDLGGTPWVSIGDKVLFKRYCGLRIDDEHVMVEDIDIYAIED